MAYTLYQLLHSKRLDLKFVNSLIPPLQHTVDVTDRMTGGFVRRYFSKKYNSYIIVTTKGSFNESEGKFYPKKVLATQYYYS